MYRQHWRDYCYSDRGTDVGTRTLVVGVEAETLTSPSFAKWNSTATVGSVVSVGGMTTSRLFRQAE